jgi:hypothetical protein
MRAIPKITSGELLIKQGATKNNYYMRGDPKITGIYFYYFLFCIFIKLYISPLQSIVHVH